MTKVMINTCYGAFSVSDEAVRHYMEANPPSDAEDTNLFLNQDVSRTDPLMISIIEAMGAAANGHGANILIVDVPAGTKYRIREYDGVEFIETADDINWQIA
jgi:hypothetical protein